MKKTITLFLNSEIKHTLIKLQTNRKRKNKKVKKS